MIEIHEWPLEDTIDVFFICESCKRFLTQRSSRAVYGDAWRDVVKTIEQYLTMKQDEHKCEAENA